MKNFRQPGNVLTVTAPAAVVSGEVIVVGSLIGVAATDAASGAPVEIALDGVFDIPKAAEPVAVGEPAYWDAAGPQATITPGTGSKPLMGNIARDAAIGAATCEVRLSQTTLTGPA